MRTKATKISEAAAAPPITESALSIRSGVEILEAQTNAEKHEVVVTLMKEGSGNAYHRNWYRRSAVESVKRLIESGRKKMYFNHAADMDNPERDIRDWAASILEANVEERDGRAVLRGRVRIHDPWLWERAKTAPDELAVSIEGRGKGKAEVIEGREFNAIEEVSWLNGVSWVDYPGNSDMGVQVLESQKSKQVEEDDMTLKQILEKVKTLAGEERAAFLKEQGVTEVDLKALAPVPAPAPEGDKLAELAKQVEDIKAKGETEATGLKEQLAAIKAENTRLANKAEAHELKEKAMGKERLVEKLLAGSKLKDEHKTATFRETLLAVQEYKKGEQVVTEEAQMKALIEDREKICVAAVATPSQTGDGSETGVPVEEQHRRFALGIFGVDPTVKEPGQTKTDKGDDKDAKVA